MIVLEGKTDHEFILEMNEEEKNIFLWLYKTKYTGEELKTEDEQLNWAANESIREQLKRWEHENDKSQNRKQRTKK